MFAVVISFSLIMAYIYVYCECMPIMSMSVRSCAVILYYPFNISLIVLNTVILKSIIRYIHVN